MLSSFHCCDSVQKNPLSNVNGFGMFKAIPGIEIRYSFACTHSWRTGRAKPTVKAVFGFKTPIYHNLSLYLHCVHSIVNTIFLAMEHCELRFFRIISFTIVLDPFYIWAWTKPYLFLCPRLCGRLFNDRTEDILQNLSIRFVSKFSLSKHELFSILFPAQCPKPISMSMCRKGFSCSSIRPNIYRICKPVPYLKCSRTMCKETFIH